MARQVTMPQKKDEVAQLLPMIGSIAGSYLGPGGSAAGGAVGGAVGGSEQQTNLNQVQAPPPQQQAALERRLAANRGSEEGQLAQGLAVAKNSNDPNINQFTDSLQEALKRARQRRIQNQSIGGGGGSLA